MKPSLHNKSSLLMAGENSLYGHENYKTVEPYQNNQKNSLSNEILYESNVRQVYKRPGYTTQDLPYRPEGIQQKQKLNQKLYTENSERMRISRKNYEQNKNSLSHLQLQSQKISQFYKASPNKSPSKNIHYHKIDQERIKKIMKKLTFGRLRKMQALVRGFLVRRKVYPKLLEEYLIAKSVLSLIQANVVYREISTIIMETITFPKYEDQGQLVELYKGRQKIIEDMIYESIVQKVIQKQLKPIIQQSLTQRGLLMNRPQITFGFNLRDPLELLLYEKLLGIMSFQLKNVCEESIKDQALDRRQLFVIDQWIDKHNMLMPLYEQIANEILEQNIGYYVVEDILQKMIRQGAFVVAQTVYNNEVNDWYMKTVQEIKDHVQEAVIEQAFSEALIEMGYGLEKKIQPNEPL